MTKPETKTKKHGGGRPSAYSEALANKICGMIEEGYSEREIGRMRGMPCPFTLRRWKDEHPEFCARSAQARATSAELFDDRRRQKAEELTTIARKALETGEDIPRGVVEALKASMQEDARSAAMRDDSRFGDRKRVALTGANGGALEVKKEETFDLSGMSTEDLEKLDELLKNALAAE